VLDAFDWLVESKATRLAHDLTAFEAWLDVLSWPPLDCADCPSPTTRRPHWNRTRNQAANQEARPGKPKVRRKR